MFPHSSTTVVATYNRQQQQQQRRTENGSIHSTTMTTTSRLPRPKDNIIRPVKTFHANSTLIPINSTNKTKGVRLQAFVASVGPIFPAPNRYKQWLRRSSTTARSPCTVFFRRRPQNKTKQNKQKKNHNAETGQL